MHAIERVTSLLLQEPFALYPGEELVRAPHFTVAGKTNNADYRPGICPLPVVPPHHAIRLQARVDFMRGDERVKAGDQWQIEGPITYHPESLVVRMSRAQCFRLPIFIIIRIRIFRSTFKLFQIRVHVHVPVTQVILRICKSNKTKIADFANRPIQQRFFIHTFCEVDVHVHAHVHVCAGIVGDRQYCGADRDRNERGVTTVRH